MARITNHQAFEGSFQVLAGRFLKEGEYLVSIIDDKVWPSKEMSGRSKQTT